VVKRVAGRAGARPREASDKAGENVSEITLHTLRRTLATLLLNGFPAREPVRAEVFKALCGHTDVRTTLAYYAELEQATVVAEIRRAV
jgi:integrase